MKPILRKIDTGAEFSFSIREDIFPHLYKHWHYHPELELTYIRKGSGMRLVGDGIERFTDGDLVLLGPNLPHLWRSDPGYFKKNNSMQAEAIAIHFMEDCFGNAFMGLPEMQSVKKLLAKSAKGIRIRGRTKAIVVEAMENILQAREAKRIAMLLDILHTVSVSKELQILASTGFTESYDTGNTDRINRIYSYSFSHFQEKIFISQVAAAASISQHSFCRYFKKRTNKTYWRFLQELRIGYASKLLIETDMSVARICYDSGFNNLSNFNRYFKLIKKKTPLQWQKEFAVESGVIE